MKNGKAELGSILIVDDDPDILLSARLVLRNAFSSIHTESHPHQLGELLGRNAFDLVLLDMNFAAGFTSGKEGLRWVKKIRKLSPSSKGVLMTAYGDIDLAVRAMKEGAKDFVVKPWDNDELSAKLRDIMSSPDVEATAPPPLAMNNKPLPEMIGISPAMMELQRFIDKVADSSANVLIYGENGTGKELAAREIHMRSARKNGPFVHVDLGAIAESLFESEMFGHKKGAFTDARHDRIGRMEAEQ